MIICIYIQPDNTYSTKQAALGGDEGVSDFRTVLRRSQSPSVPRPDPSKSEAAQLDFRTVLHKTDGGLSPKRTIEAGEQKYRSEKARQEDFRGQLKRKVETKDCSSAAPKRSVTPHQEDFRGLLKKTEEGGRSQRGGLTPATTSPPPRTATSPQSDEAGTGKEEDTEVVGMLQPETTPTPNKSPVPPPVKSKPKMSPRPSPIPPEMQDESSGSIPHQERHDEQQDSTITTTSANSNQPNLAQDDEDRDTIDGED